MFVVLCFLSCVVVGRSMKQGINVIPTQSFENLHSNYLYGTSNDGAYKLDSIGLLNNQKSFLMKIYRQDSFFKLF